MNDLDYLRDARRQFEMYKKLADKAISRIDDDQFFRVASEGTNSIAVVVKHMAGNMRSRWTDYLNTDGEKPDRQRDTEFEIDSSNSRAELMKRWEAGWQLLYDAITEAETLELSHMITIRSEPYTILQAVNRQLTHYAYHVGQIVLLAIQLLGPAWESLSVPKNKSEQFNIDMREKHGSDE